ncbi:MAG: NAD(P)H-dependent oxidoreductase [Beijerinckiaceae bacterium]|nr:NAD(P)H-dependent oxidoreductase [Beijerinckiaceae bacterium]
MTRILVFSGATRPASLNRRLAAIATRDLRAMGATVTEISLLDFPLPFVDEDGRPNPPQEAHAFNAALQGHDGIFIATPEYNSGYPPILKNALDWASMCNGGKPGLGGKVVALGAASPSPRGGYRVLTQLRSTLELGFGALVIPEMAPVPFANKALAEDGTIADEASAKMLAACLQRLVAEVKLRQKD